MKKNRTMKAAAVLMALCLMTSCFVGGTFAKYTTTVGSFDTVRVAKWGFNETGMDLTGLFAEAYDINGGGKAVGKDGADIIAPGTAGTDTFKFSYLEPNDKPEVKYTFDVKTVVNAEVGTLGDLDKNENFFWTLMVTDKNGVSGAPAEYQTVAELVKAINDLSGSTNGSGTMVYDAGTLPAAFNDNQVYTVGWVWKFGDGSDAKVYDMDGDSVADYTQDQFDTYMGNKALSALDKFTLSITITAEQYGAN